MLASSRPEGVVRAFLVVLFGARCVCSNYGLETKTFSCASSQDCTQGYACISSQCVLSDGGSTPGSDAGVPDAASAADAGSGADSGTIDGGALDAASCPGIPPRPQSGGRTYYVSASGSDCNTGGQADPFETIQRAANQVNPGDTVIVQSGTYYAPTGQQVVNITKGGAQGNWIWFKSEEKWGAQLNGQANQVATAWSFASGTGFVRIEGFEVVQFGGYSGANVFDLSKGGHDVDIVGNHFHDINRLCTPSSQSSACVFVGQDRVTVEGNLFHDFGRFPSGGGCDLGDAGNHTYDSDMGVYVVQVGSPDSGTTAIRNNIFYNCTSGWCVAVYHNTWGLQLVNNTFAGANPGGEIGQITLQYLSLGNSEIANNIFFQPLVTAIDNNNSGFSGSAIQNNLTTAGLMIDPPVDGGVVFSGNLVNVPDPMFVDAGGFDFELRAGSPALGAGTSSAGVLFDFNGCPRPQDGGVDIGAYQLSSGAGG
jgi:hypothetical protein